MREREKEPLIFKHASARLPYQQPQRPVHKGPAGKVFPHSWAQAWQNCWLNRMDKDEGVRLLVAKWRRLLCFPERPIEPRATAAENNASSFQVSRSLLCNMARVKS